MCVIIGSLSKGNQIACNTSCKGRLCMINFLVIILMVLYGFGWLVDWFYDMSTLIRLFYNLISVDTLFLCQNQFRFVFLLKIREGKPKDNFKCKYWLLGWFHKEFSTSHFQGEILVCTYTICVHGQILISYTIPIESLFPLALLVEVVEYTNCFSADG